jgi:sugar lactone lactonase YvrE
VRPHNIRLQVFRKDGTFVAEYVFDKETLTKGSVSEIAFSPDPQQKFIHFVDSRNGEIRIVERATLQTVGLFGRVGRQAGQFTVVHNITVDRQGNIYTTEVRTAQRIQKFRRLDTAN